MAKEEKHEKGNDGPPVEIERRVMATANFTQEDIERLLKRAEYQIESNRLVYWTIGFAIAAILLLPLVIAIKNVKP